MNGNAGKVVSAGCQLAPPSGVEQIALKESGYQLCYAPCERIGIIVVSCFPALGRLAALRFLEWVQAHPQGVIALPTGKTPEHFICGVQRYLRSWDRPEIAHELEQGGVDPARRPEMRELSFVQIDEFYPISPLQHNSFYHYVQYFYLRGFGLDPDRAMLIDPSRIGLRPGERLEEVFPNGIADLALRTRRARSLLEKRQQDVLAEVDQFCSEYESRIRALGGIGFFLGGIGPDGHIGFNVRGADRFSTTRLAGTNYETQAAAATDLGGIEVAGGKHVITIGLQTITWRTDAVAIIMAAGHAKAAVVRDAIQNPLDNRYPASCLQQLPAARFYLTRGAASALYARTCVDFERELEITSEVADRIIIDACTDYQVHLDEASVCAEGSHLVTALAERTGQPVAELAMQARQRIIDRLQLGLAVPGDEVFLHTAPHHDDIMLGYLPYLMRLLQDPGNRHVFAYMTSGFTAVTNSSTAAMVDSALAYMQTPECTRLNAQGYFLPDSRENMIADVALFLDGLARDRDITMRQAATRRFVRNSIAVFEDDSLENLRNRLAEMLSYLQTQYPGKKDLPHIQQLKGMMREWEAECMWGYYGFTGDSVRHLRLGFYRGDLFTQDPTRQRDVKPVLDLLRVVQPTTISVAMDPEGSGPDTHYKVLQTICAAVREYIDIVRPSRLCILGYRNVWYRFHPAEANLMVPVSLSHIVDLEHVFLSCFVTQRDASFPSWEYDGPFCRLARRIQVHQYEWLESLLAPGFFDLHSDSRLRAARAVVFLCRMSPETFFRRCDQLRLAAENPGDTSR